MRNELIQVHNRHFTTHSCCVSIKRSKISDVRHLTYQDRLEFNRGELVQWHFIKIRSAIPSPHFLLWLSTWIGGYYKILVTGGFEKKQLLDHRFTSWEKPRSTAFHLTSAARSWIQIPTLYIHMILFLDSILTSQVNFIAKGFRMIYMTLIVSSWRVQKTCITVAAYLSVTLQSKFDPNLPQRPTQFTFSINFYRKIFLIAAFEITK